VNIPATIPATIPSPVDKALKFVPAVFRRLMSAERASSSDQSATLSSDQLGLLTEGIVNTIRDCDTEQAGAKSRVKPRDTLSLDCSGDSFGDCLPCQLSSLQTKASAGYRLTTFSFLVCTAARVERLTSGL
jgi:hypothetical protein